MVFAEWWVIKAQNFGTNALAIQESIQSCHESERLMVA
jgi:hypothetical protein